MGGGTMEVFHSPREGVCPSLASVTNAPQPTATAETNVSQPTATVETNAPQPTATVETNVSQPTATVETNAPQPKGKGRRVKPLLIGARKPCKAISKPKDPLKGSSWKEFVFFKKTANSLFLPATRRRYSHLIRWAKRDPTYDIMSEKLPLKALFRFTDRGTQDYSDLPAIPEEKFEIRDEEELPAAAEEEDKDTTLPDFIKCHPGQSLYYQCDLCKKIHCDLCKTGGKFDPNDYDPERIFYCIGCKDDLCDFDSVLHESDEEEERDSKELVEMEDPDADENTPADPAILKETIIKWRRKKPNRKPAQALVQRGLQRAQETNAKVVDITPRCEFTVLVDPIPVCATFPPTVVGNTTSMEVDPIPVYATFPPAVMVEPIPLCATTPLLEQASKKMPLAEFYKARQNVPDERYQKLATEMQEILVGFDIGFAVVTPCTPKSGTDSRLCCGPIQICMSQKMRSNGKHIDYYYLLLSVDDNTSGSFYRSVPMLVEGLLDLPFDITTVVGDTSAMMADAPQCDYAVLVYTIEIPHQ